MKNTLIKYFKRQPKSLQKYLINCIEFLNKSIFWSLIKLLVSNSKTPFCYLKYFSIWSLKNWYIKIWKHVDLWKWFKCLAPWKIEIWDYTYLAGCNLLTPSDENYIKIWRYCSISDGVNFIAWFYHDYKLYSTSPSVFMWYQLWAPIDIGNDVWIWRNVIILKWVKIWNWSCIGAWAVVTKDIPPYAIVAWNPAKIIKYRFEKTIIEELERSKRWDEEPENVKQFFKWIKKI